MTASEMLEAAVTDYEKLSGFDAVNYRGLRKNASLAKKIAAVRADLRWWELHAQEVSSKLDRVAGDLSLILEA